MLTFLLYYLSEFLRWDLMCIILVEFFRTVIHIFILVSSWTPCLINSQTLKRISQVESFLSPDKQGTPEEAGGYSVRNVLLQLTTIKMRTAVQNATNKIMHFYGRIHRLHLCREVRSPPPNECPGYDTKQISWWGFSNAGALGGCEIPLHCHTSQVHSGPE